MNRWRVTRSIGVVLFFGYLLSGCAISSPSEESHFYLLSSPELNSTSCRTPGKVPDCVSENVIITSIGPIYFADYLKRSSVVTQSTNNQYEIAKLDQWGGSLEYEFEMALLKNMMAMNPRQRFVLDSGMLSRRSNHSLKIDVYRFDARKGNFARLEAAWSWVNQSGQEVVSGTFRENVRAGSSVEEQVMAMSSLVTLFARSLSSKMYSFPGE
ncbi:MAG: hypothetical protein CSA52_00585 [Gammaproteobacteria bacterium]|nr:MAG: hypothetical protein CSB48_06555 [Pseudomonadota bacterium]PIE38900.1 MAG: hypothetical protein CSA52_00585 [Gammaproteobacteria bacterium]